MCQLVLKILSGKLTAIAPVHSNCALKWKIVIKGNKMSWSRKLLLHIAKHAKPFDEKSVEDETVDITKNQVCSCQTAKMMKEHGEWLLLHHVWMFETSSRILRPFCSPQTLNSFSRYLIVYGNLCKSTTTLKVPKGVV